MKCTKETEMLKKFLQRATFAHKWIRDGYLMKNEAKWYQFDKKRKGEQKIKDGFNQLIKSGEEVVQIECGP
jgi:hypothetical protein